MIISVRVNNYKAYPGKNELSLKANMRIKKFNTNVHKAGKFNVLKSACIYGGNNVGKTCMLNAINSIKNVLLSSPADVTANLFSNNQVCELGITFLYQNGVYSYDFKFDNNGGPMNRRAFIYERLATVSIDSYGNETEKVLFLRDVDGEKYVFSNNDDLTKLLSSISTTNILIYTINSEKFPEIQKYKELLAGFASTIDFIDMNNIPVDRTIKVLKENEEIKNKTVELIKKADIEIDDFSYANDPSVKVSVDQVAGPISPQEIALRALQVEDMLKLQSIHKGKAVQSLLFDSTGTKKMVALASYIIDATEKGRVLVVDELDSSLHFKLTRAIVALFNNEINDSGQLICAVHDVTLLDCRRLFRKDQIWFANKEAYGSSIKPLSSFTSLKDNVRSDNDIRAKYEAGMFGELPEPDFVSTLIGDDADEE